MSDRGLLSRTAAGDRAQIKVKVKLKFYIFSNDISKTLHAIPFVFFFLLIVLSKKESTNSSNKWTKILYRGYLHRIANSVSETGNVFSKEIISNDTKSNVKNKFGSLYETFESTDEMKLMMKFYLHLHNCSEV